MPALTQNDEQVWDRLKEGTYCIIWLKTEEKSILRVLEVLEVVDGQQLIGWHYIHRAPGASSDTSMPYSSITVTGTNVSSIYK